MWGVVATHGTRPIVGGRGKTKGFVFFPDFIFVFLRYSSTETHRP